VDVELSITILVVVSSTNDNVFISGEWSCDSGGGNDCILHVHRDVNQFLLTILFNRDLSSWVGLDFILSTKGCCLPSRNAALHGQGSLATVVSHSKLRHQIHVEVVENKFQFEILVWCTIQIIGSINLKLLDVCGNDCGGELHFQYTIPALVLAGVLQICGDHLSPIVRSHNVVFSHCWIKRNLQILLSGVGRSSLNDKAGLIKFDMDFGNFGIQSY